MANDKIKRMAYLIYVDWELSKHGKMTEELIGTMFNRSQGTVSGWVNEVDASNFTIDSKDTEVQREIKYLKSIIQQLEEYRVITFPKFNDK